MTWAYMQKKQQELHICMCGGIWICGICIQERQKPMNKDCYKAWKHYCSLKVSRDVKNLIIVLEGSIVLYVLLLHNALSLFITIIYV